MKKAVRKEAARKKRHEVKRYEGKRHIERKMHMNGTERLAAFEKMLVAVRENHAQTDETMRRLREQGKEKTATYRQLMGNRMVYQNLLSLYKAYGLLEGEEGT